MRATFRPLAQWPYPEQKHRPALFKVGYSRTLQDLEYEIDQLRGSELIIGIVAAERDIRIDGIVAAERDIRIDGLLRADAKVGHAGVEVSFEVPDGRRLTFHTDVHAGFANSWRDNLRAIALGLEALRAVQRYGITTGIGEQYAGFAQLTAGGPDPARGKQLVERAGGLRQALMLHHPDHGGQPRDVADVIAYRDSQGATP